MKPLDFFPPTAHEKAMDAFLEEQKKKLTDSKDRKEAANLSNKTKKQEDKK
jgi:hypothetical protein